MGRTEKKVAEKTEKVKDVEQDVKEEKKEEKKVKATETETKKKTTKSKEENEKTTKKEVKEEPVKEDSESESESESEEREEREVSFDDISLKVVEYNPEYRRTRATVSQLLRAFEDMHKRLNDTENDYQKKLYPYIQQQCKNIPEKYSELLGKIAKEDYNIFGLYLNGSRNNGSRKSTNVRAEMRKFRDSQYKELLRSIDDRLHFTRRDAEKKMRDITRNDSAVFKRYVEFANTFKEFIKNKMAEWRTFVDETRKEFNIEKKPKPQMSRFHQGQRPPRFNQQHMKPIIPHHQYQHAPIYPQQNQMPYPVHQAQVQSQPQFPHQRAPRPYQNGGHPLQQHEGGKFMGKPSPKGPYSSKFPHGNNRPYDKHEKPYN